MGILRPRAATFKLRANRDTFERLQNGWKPSFIGAEDLAQLIPVLDARGYDVTRVGSNNLEFTPGLFLRFDYIQLDHHGDRVLTPGHGFATDRIELDITDPKKQLRVDKDAKLFGYTQ